jgi:cation:H+ antiporter
MIWVEFSIAAILVIFFGFKLSEKADALAEIKGFGKGIVGFVLLGFATSLPELIATVSSTLFLDNPDLGAGNIIGSNNANLFILAVSLFFASSLRKKKNTVDVESLVSISFCFLAVSVFFTALFFSGKPVIEGVSIFSIFLIILFFASIAALAGNNRSDNQESRNPGHAGPFFYILLVFYIIVLVAVSYYLAGIVERISVLTGLSASTSGAIFLAWATSLPELVVTISAIVIGSSEMGIGNILGSNIFNFSILAIADILSRSSKSIYSATDEIPLLTAVQFIILSIILYMVSAKKLPMIGKRISSLTLLIAAVYIAGIYLII